MVWKLLNSFCIGMEVGPWLLTFSPEIRCFFWILVFVDTNHYQSFGGGFLMKLFERW